MKKLLSILLLVPVAVAAAPILDQQNSSGSTGYLGIGTVNQHDVAQTFTVGVTGTLTQVDVFIAHDLIANPIPPLVLEIQTLAGAEPSGTVLASSSRNDIPQSRQFSWISFDLTAGLLNVVLGQQLAIVLSAPDSLTTIGGAGGWDYLWMVTAPLPPGDGYAAGTAFSRIAGGAWGDPADGTSRNADMWFRTFVEPGSVNVPEPGTLGLLGLGLAGLMFARRRRS